MANQYTMHIILMIIFSCCGYLFLLQFLASRPPGQPLAAPMAVILLLVYACIVSAAGLILHTALGMEYLLPLCTLCAISGLLYASGRNLAFHKHDINRRILLLFFIYILALGYVTLFSRYDRGQTEILLQFDAFENALRKHSFDPLEHLLQNIVLFIPLGLLLPMIYPNSMHKWLIVLGCAMLLTASIESIQLLFQLGQVDVEDLAANVIGSLIGYGSYLICAKKELIK